MTQSNIKKITDFFKSEYIKLTYYVRGRISDSADRDSEDIVQDVMTAIFEKADISDPIEDIAAYVYRSLKNRIIDVLRKKTVRTDSIDAGDDSLSLINIIADINNTPEKVYEQEEINRILYEAVERLPDDYKSVLVMNEIEGKTFREISEDTGIPAGTLMARKARAIEILKDNLKNYKIYMEE